MLGLSKNSSHDSGDAEFAYDANCHCGIVQITFSLPHPLGSPEYPVMHCNCSICHFNGYLNVYPKRKNFNVTQGYENLTDYTMGAKNKLHKFCKTCGSSIMIDFRKLELGITDSPEEDTLAVNVRMVRGIDLRDLVYQEFDGYSLLEPQYDIHRSSEATLPSSSEAALPSRSPSPVERPQFSLAGTHLPIAHQTAVIEEKPKDEPIWSLAKPLPHVERAD